LWLSKLPRRRTTRLPSQNSAQDAPLDGPHQNPNIPSQNSAQDAPLDGPHQNPNLRKLSACSHTTSFTITMLSKVVKIRE